jgi:dihydrofolate reductase
MGITIIAAVDNNGGIGLNGKLPWHVPAELAHFHRTVADTLTVCGARTYPTLPKKLRKHTLVWSGRGLEGVGATYNTDQILSLGAFRDVAIIGGAVIIGVGLFARYYPRERLVALVTPPARRAGEIVSRFLTIRIGANAAERVEEGCVVTLADTARAALDAFIAGLLADNSRRSRE